MSRTLSMAPVERVEGTLRPPGSKSITNRALVCASLASGRSHLRGALDSEDTQVMIDSLQRLGIAVRHDPTRCSIEVDGCGGIIPAQQADLFVGNSGTTIRFLTALTALGQGTFRLDGVERMRQRPIGDLLQALQQWGADVRAEYDNGCPPVIVAARGLAGGQVAVRGDVSSQFLSGLLLSAPYCRHDAELRVVGPLVSEPYVIMTGRVMQAFGAGVERQGPLVRVAADRPYQGRDYEIEPDASAASYFWGAAAITGGSVSVQGLTRDALQGDVQFCEALRQMGCDVDYRPGEIRVTGGTLRGIDVDMNAISDTVPTLAAIAMFATGPTQIRGVGHIRHKETDRIGDLAREIRKLGAEVTEGPDGLQITPRALHGAEVDTYQDHRMAMALSLVGLRVAGVVIRDPDCTRKTYPDYFRDLDSICRRQKHSGG